MDAFKYFGKLYGCTDDQIAVKNEDKSSADELDSGSSDISTSVSALSDAPKTLIDQSEQHLTNLLSQMEKSIKNERRMKAVSTCHSQEWSNIAPQNEDGVDIINTRFLNSRIELEKATSLKNEKKAENYCCFEAGATIEEVNECLWPEEKRNSLEGKVLLNQTGCVKLSLAGTIATAAHGNGLSKPIIADMVRSFRIITVESGIVKQYQLEPENGITDSKSFSDKFKDVELKQDNDLFYAALVNIGCMGIVYSYILEIEDAFYLKENRTMLSWKDAKKELEVLYNDKETSLHSFELFVCPYPPIDSDLKFDEQIQVVICKLEKSKGPLEGTRPKLYFVQPEWIRKAFITACEKNPEIIPLMICLMMNATQCKDVVMSACEALDPLSGLAVSGEVQVSECAMEVTSAKDIINKVDDVIRKFQDIRKDNRNQLATGPFAVRFSKESKAYMAMQYDRQSMMIISNILKGTPEADNTLKRFRNDMERKNKGRPHWGMIHDMDKEKVKTLYGQKAVEKFKAALNKFDPDKIFSNEFTAKVFEHVKK